MLAILTALAVTASVIAVGQRNAAIQQRSTAIQQRDLAVSSQIAAAADQVGTADPAVFAQLLLAAYRIHPSQDLASRLISSENQPLPALITTSGSLSSVAFSSKGQTLASDGDGTIRLWDVTSPVRPREIGKPLITGSSNFVNSVAIISPDGRTLASNGADDTIRLWNITDTARPRKLGRPLTTSRGFAMQTVAFSPDGRTLAGGDLEGVIWLWDVTDPAQRANSASR
jgi:WD40 repeat protein